MVDTILQTKGREALPFAVRQRFAKTTDGRRKYGRSWDIRDCRLRIRNALIPVEDGSTPAFYMLPSSSNSDWSEQASKAANRSATSAAHDGSTIFDDVDD